MKAKMHILATCQYGYPEPYPSLYPMEEMAKRGHFVHAITGMPNYPMGNIFEGYQNHSVVEEEHNGVYISHVPIIPRKQNAICRLLNYHSYPISAKKKILQLPGDYDVVFANQSSPVMMVEPAIAYGKKWNKKVVMYCMDLWPASLEVGGVKKGSLIYNYYHNISKKIYTSVDLILVTSRMFKDYFVSEFQISENKIKYLPQYAVSEEQFTISQDDKNTTDFVFAGNVGSAQNLTIVLKAAEIIQKENITDHGKAIQFHIVGNGQELENLKKFCREKQIQNVIFHGRRPLEEMPVFYGMADAMMVTLTSNELVSLTLPAKVQSYMAAGKPILASANGEIEKVLAESQAGYCSPADNVQAFVDIIKKFMLDTNRKLYGQRAKQFYENHFAREKVMDKLERILEECAICKN